MRLERLSHEQGAVYRPAAANEQLDETEKKVFKDDAPYNSALLETHRAAINGKLKCIHFTVLYQI